MDEGLPARRRIGNVSMVVERESAERYSCYNKRGWLRFFPTTKTKMKNEVTRINEIHLDGDFDARNIVGHSIINGMDKDCNRLCRSV